MNEENNVINLDTPSGKLDIEMARFGALDGYQLKRQFFEFCETEDSAKRSQFIVRVMAYARAGETTLGTQKAIDAVLGDWQALERAFSAVLAYNGINRTLWQEEKREVWEQAGREMAASFVAAAGLYFEPLFASLDIKQKE